MPSRADVPSQPHVRLLTGVYSFGSSADSGGHSDALPVQPGKRQQAAVAARDVGAASAEKERGHVPGLPPTGEPRHNEREKPSAAQPIDNAQQQ